MLGKLLEGMVTDDHNYQLLRVRREENALTPQVLSILGHEDRETELEKLVEEVQFYVLLRVVVVGVEALCCTGTTVAVHQNSLVVV